MKINSTAKIAIISVISIIIAFVSISSFYSLSQYILYSNSEDFFLPELERQKIVRDDFLSKPISENEKRIYIVGFSQLVSLNPIIIQNKLSDNGYDYTVYNLSLNGGIFEQQPELFKQIIKTKPELVIYGVSTHSFQKDKSGSDYFNQSADAWKSPSIFQIAKFLNVPSDIFAFLDNPKLTTLQAIQYVLRTSSADRENFEYFSPYPQGFVRISNSSTQILNEYQLKKYFSEYSPMNFNGIELLETSQNAKILQEIFNMLEKNDIKLIIFTTPVSKYSLEGISEKDKENFNQILQNAGGNKTANVYPLLDRYADLAIWYEPVHIAINPEITIFNEDISNIILKELD